MTTQYFRNYNQSDKLEIKFTPKQKKLFLRGFWILCGLSFWVIMTADANFVSILAALITAIAALFPGFLWCSDHAKGLPLFPLLALNYLFTHSFPLIGDNPAVLKYSPFEHLISSLAVLVFLGVATINWILYVQQPHTHHVKLRKFNQKHIFPFFIIVLISGIIYQILAISGYIWLLLPYPGILSAIKTISHGLNSFAVIILGYMMGSKILSKVQVWVFLIVMASLIFVSGASLYLGTTAFYILFSSMGWMFAAKKIPWRLLLVSLSIVAFLHLGKGDTRHYYWEIRNTGIQPSEYTQVYQYWIDNSIQKIRQPNEDSTSHINVEADNSGTFVNRSSVVHMLLQVQSETGKNKPYLWGETYSIIPELLIPRFLYPDKIRGAEANHMLSVHYGLQTYEQTLGTSIGWGLLQEAYANFGWLGCLGLGVFLGNLYGWITRWSMNVSSFSFRFLVALIFMILAFKGEITMGIFTTVIFQSMIMLSAIRIFLMRNDNSSSIILKTKIIDQSNTAVSK